MLIFPDNDLNLKLDEGKHSVRDILACILANIFPISRYKGLDSWNNMAVVTLLNNNVIIKAVALKKLCY